MSSLRNRRLQRRERGSEGRTGNRYNGDKNTVSEQATVFQNGLPVTPAPPRLPFIVLWRRGEEELARLNSVTPQCCIKKIEDYRGSSVGMKLEDIAIKIKVDYGLMDCTFPL